MTDLLGSGTLDPRDMERWEGLAVLLGALGSERERAHFAALFRREAPAAEEALSGLLDAAATLWAREEGRPVQSTLPPVPASCGRHAVAA